MAEDAGIGSNKKCFFWRQSVVKEHAQVDITTLQVIFGMPYWFPRKERIEPGNSLLQRNTIREEDECLTLDKMKILSWLWRWWRCDFRCQASLLVVQGGKWVSEAKGKYLMLMPAVCCNNLVTQIRSGTCLVTIRLTLGNWGNALLCYSISVVLVCLAPAVFR